MNEVISRRRMLCSSAALAGAGFLPASHACEIQAEFLRVIHPWTRATAPDAEFGVLCMRIDDVRVNDRLIDVSTPVADAALLPGAPAGQALGLDIPVGTTIDMTEQGLHLRLAPLRLQLIAGRSYPLQLTFARSGVVDTMLTVDYPRFA